MKLASQTCVLYPFSFYFSYGDSGGPLIIKGDSIEEDELVGTVSW